MFAFSNFLTEQKNLHMEHLKDEVLNHGVEGTRGAINFLQGLRDMLAGNSASSVDVTVKWDGAPAVFAGTNPENGQFFVGTKGVFAQNPKLNKKPGHIMKNHPDGMRDGEVVDKSGLRDKLGDAYKHLRKLGIKEVLQGDLLFTPDMLEVYEIDGKDYHFIDKKKFDLLVKNNSFFEYAKIFDNYYGTLKSPVLKLLSQEKDVLFDIDWQGTQQLKKIKNLSIITFFILPPNINALKERLLNRHESQEALIKKRMEKFNEEISHWNEYNYVVVNDDLNKCYNQILNIIISEKKGKRQKQNISEIKKKIEELRV